MTRGVQRFHTGSPLGICIEYFVSVQGVPGFRLQNLGTCGDHQVTSELLSKAAQEANYVIQIT